MIKNIIKKKGRKRIYDKISLLFDFLIFHIFLINLACKFKKFINKNFLLNLNFIDIMDPPNICFFHAQQSIV